MNERSKRVTTAMVLAVIIAGCNTYRDLATEPLFSDSVRLSIEFPHEVRVGEKIPLRFQAKNVGLQPVEIQLTSRPPVFDVVVRSPDGTEVWRRLHSRFFYNALLTRKTLNPGEVLELTGEWDQRDKDGKPITPGTYSVQGALPGVGSPSHTTEISLLTITP